METTRYSEEPRLAAVVHELAESDARFRRWWGEHDVAARGKGTKTLHHPIVGELVLDWDTLICGPTPTRASSSGPRVPDPPPETNAADCTPPAGEPGQPAGSKVTLNAAPL